MSKVRLNIIAGFGGKTWSALMSFVFVPLYIKFMGIESYGLVGIFTSLFALFSLLDMGLSATLNRELAKLSAFPGKSQDMRNIVRTLELPYWAMSLFICMAVVSLSGLIANHWVKADYLGPTVMKHALMIMGCVMAFRWPVSLYSGGLMGLQRHVLLNIVSVCEATLRGLGSVLVLWLISPTVQAFFIWQLFVSILHVSVVALCLWHCLPKGFQRAQFEKEFFVLTWRFAAGMTGISLTAVLLTQTDKIVLSKVLSLEMFGYYTFAGVVAKSLTMFIVPIFSAVYPRLSQMVSVNDLEALKDLYHKSCQLVAIMVLPLAIILSLFSREILYLWTVDLNIVANTYKIASILVIGTALNGLMNIPYALQLAYGWTSLALFSNVFAVIIFIPMVFFLAIYWGAVGAAFAWVILNACYVLVSIHIMHRRLLSKEKLVWYLNDVFAPMIGAILVAVLLRCLYPCEISSIGSGVFLAVTLILSLTGAIVVTNLNKIVLLRLKLL